MGVTKLQAIAEYCPKNERESVTYEKKRRESWRKLTINILFLYSSWYFTKLAGACLIGTATRGSLLSAGINHIILGPCMSFLSRLALSNVIA